MPVGHAAGQGGEVRDRDGARPDERLEDRIGIGGIDRGIAILALPRAGQRDPAIGQFAEQREPCTHILAALVIVRGRRQHRLRMGLRPFGDRSRELRLADRHARRIEPHVGAGKQPGVAIEGGILHRLGGQRRAQLFEPADGIAAERRIQPGLSGQRIGEHGQHRRLARRHGGPGTIERGGEQRIMRQRRGRACAVTPVIWQFHEQRRHRAGDHSAGDVPRRDAGLRPAVQGGDRGVALAREGPCQRLGARRPFLVREGRGSPAQPVPVRGQRRIAGRIMLERRYQIHEIVAAGAVGAPGGIEPFAGGEDLFHHDPGGPGSRVGGAARAGGVQRRAQAARIAARVRKPVDMIDADAVDEPVGIEAEGQRVHGIENLRVFDAQPGQFGDIEEAPPVDRIPGRAPMGQPVMLAFEQPVQPLQSGRGARIVMRRRIGRPRQRRGIIRTQREAVRAVRHHERRLAGAVPIDHHRARGQRLGIRQAEERGEQLAMQCGVGGCPVDIEIACIATVPPMFEHVQPPRIVAAADGHVIGHDIEDDADPVRLQRSGERPEPRFATRFGIDVQRIDHVIAMVRARTRRRDRGRIDMADPEIGQIGRERTRRIEGKSAVELDAVGGAGDHPVLDSVMRATRSRTAGAENSRAAVSGSRRCQFGWVSTVPGRLGA